MTAAQSSLMHWALERLARQGGIDICVFDKAHQASSLCRTLSRFTTQRRCKCLANGRIHAACASIFPSCSAR